MVVRCYGRLKGHNQEVVAPLTVVEGEWRRSSLQVHSLETLHLLLYFAKRCERDITLCCSAQADSFVIPDTYTIQIYNL
jgi:hypothetical protein